MAMRQLILQYRQQISNNVQPLRDEANSLVHLEIAPGGLVKGLQLGLHPEELGGIQHGAVEVDVDSQDEELSDLHIYLFPAQGDFARQGDLGRNVLAGVDGGSDELLEERCLRFALVDRTSDLSICLQVHHTLTLCARAWEMASLVM